MPISKKRRDEIASRGSEKIDFSDIAELDESFFKNATLVLPAQPKKQLTVRFDADVIEWFRAQGKGYQTRMNAVLRKYVDVMQEK